MSSNGTSSSSSEDGLGGGVIWIITFSSTTLVFASIMIFICCDAYKKYHRRVPRVYDTAIRGNYPRQEPSTVTQGTTASSGETESDGGTLPQSGRVGEIGDTQTDKATGTSTVQIGSNVNMPSPSNKKSTLPPLDSRISTVSELVPEGRGTVNAGFTDKPLPSIENRSPEIVLTPVTSLNLGVSIYS
eukprot:XP_011442964.1 PREDICTED: uncharacterized protein LOC105339208 [Crassostrea gigas]